MSFRAQYSFVVEGGGLEILDIFDCRKKWKKRQQSWKRTTKKILGRANLQSEKDKKTKRIFVLLRRAQNPLQIKDSVPLDLPELYLPMLPCPQISEDDVGLD